MPHTMRRGGVFWVRFRVPLGLQEVVGRNELKRSLGTTNARLAKTRGARAVAWWRSLCDQLNMAAHLDATVIRQLIKDYFFSLKAEVDLAHAVAGFGSDRDQANEAFAADEYASELTKALATGKVDAESASAIMTFAESKALDLKSATPGLRKLASQGAMAAQIALAEYFLHRTDNPEKEYEPANELFTEPLKVAVAAPVSKALGEAVALYLDERGPFWRPRTLAEAKRVLGWFLEHAGPAATLADVTKPKAALFRLGITRLESRSTAPTFSERQTDDLSKRISARTANKYLDFVRTFFAWAADEAALLDANPFAKVSVTFKKAKSQAAKAATPEAVKAFLLSPLFQGHQPSKLHKHGSIVSRGEVYWLVLLQLALGARAGEIAQLLASDIKTHAGVRVVFIRATDDEGKELAAKHLKTAAAERTIPLPTFLLAVGFEDYVLSQAAKGPRLFPSFKPSSQESMSDKATKVVSRYLERTGLKQPGKANHWLRHAWTDAMKNASVPSYLMSQMEGHEEDGMKAVYGTGNNIAECKKWIDKADYGFDIAGTLLMSAAKWKTL